MFCSDLCQRRCREITSTAGSAPPPANIVQNGSTSPDASDSEEDIEVEFSTLEDSGQVLSSFTVTTRQLDFDTTPVAPPAVVQPATVAAEKEAETTMVSATPEVRAWPGNQVVRAVPGSFKTLEGAMANPILARTDGLDTLDDWPMDEDLIRAAQVASDAWPVARWCGNGLGGFDPSLKDQPCPGCQHCIPVKICPNGLGGFIQGKIDQECEGCLHCLPAEVLSSGLDTLPPLPRLTLELGPRSTSRPHGHRAMRHHRSSRTATTRPQVLLASSETALGQASRP